MLSGLLPDSQISASSMRDIHGSMGAARLVASRSGWFPNPTQPIAGEEWLQVRHCMTQLVFNSMVGCNVPITADCCWRIGTLYISQSIVILLLFLLVLELRFIP